MVSKLLLSSAGAATLLCMAIGQGLNFFVFLFGSTFSTNSCVCKWECLQGLKCVHSHICSDCVPGRLCKTISTFFLYIWNCCKSVILISIRCMCDHHADDQVKVHWSSGLFSVPCWFIRFKVPRLPGKGFVHHPMSLIIIKLSPWIVTKLSSWIINKLSPLIIN